MVVAFQNVDMALFDGLSPLEIEKALKSLRYLQYNQGEYIFSTGEQARSIYLLESGFVKVSYITPDGGAKILDICEAGDIFGELFLGKHRFRVGEAQAMMPCSLYRMTEEDLQRLLHDNATFGMNFIRHLVNTQRETLSRMHALLHADAQTRLLGTLLYLARHLCCSADSYFDVPPAITQQDIAELAGLNRSTVSSLINRLRHEGILGGTGRSLRVNLVAVEERLWENGFELLK